MRRSALDPTSTVRSLARSVSTDSNSGKEITDATDVIIRLVARGSATLRSRRRNGYATLRFGCGPNNSPRHVRPDEHRKRGRSCSSSTVVHRLSDDGRRNRDWCDSQTAAYREQAIVSVTCLPANISTKCMATAPIDDGITAVPARHLPLRWRGAVSGGGRHLAEARRLPTIISFLPRITA